MKKIIITLLIGFSILAVGCSSNTSSSTTNTTVKSTDNASTNEKVFTLDELSKYNGKNGNNAYVAINGVVYDVTNVKEWANGMHKQGLTAGQDLTKFLSESPHGDKVLKELPVVGKLK